MKIKIRAVDDWITVYKDGEIVWNTHSCSLKDGLKALDIPFEYEYKEWDELDEYQAQDWLEGLNV